MPRIIPGGFLATQAEIIEFTAASEPGSSAKQIDLFHPCFATRLGGVSDGKETQGWRDSSHTAIVGAGKFGSAKLHLALPAPFNVLTFVTALLWLGGFGLRRLLRFTSHSLSLQMRRECRVRYY
jgi:hypothetical protein